MIFVSAIDEFSGRLKLLRKERNMQQGELAKELDVSRGSISFYENGDRIPDIEFLSRASAYFGVSADWLLGLSDVRSADLDIKNGCAITGLTEDAIRKILNFGSSHDDEYIGNVAAFSILSNLLEHDDLYASVLCVCKAIKTRMEHSTSLSHLLHLKGDENQELLSQIMGIAADSEGYIKEAGKVILNSENAAEYFMFSAKAKFDSAISQIFSSYSDVFEKMVADSVSKD